VKQGKNGIIVEVHCPPDILRSEAKSGESLSFRAQLIERRGSVLGAALVVGAGHESVRRCKG
jgi:hypothetical protein